MARLQRRAKAAQPGRMRTLIAADESRTPGLVVSDPVTHPIAEPPADDIRELREFSHGIAVAPAAPVLQALRQVPVIERRPGFEATRERAVDEPRVEIEALLIRGTARAVGQDSRPGDRKPIGVQAQARGKVEVLRP